jgi:ribosome-binding protein aMBF1 (putative translation factor)
MGGGEGVALSALFNHHRWSAPCRNLLTRAVAPEFEIAAELPKARLRAGLSQAELAARMGTSQSTIARLEGGQTLPSTKTLLRYAEATGSKFHVRLSAA